MAPALEGPSLQHEAWHPPGHVRKKFTRRSEQKLNEHPPGARASCNVYTACRFIHESHASAFPPLIAHLAEAACLRRRVSRSTRKTSSFPSGPLPAWQNPTSSRRDQERETPTSPATWTTPGQENRLNYFAIFSSACRAPAFKRLPREVRRYLHKAIGSGTDLAAALALGQQRPQSWNHPRGPASRSGTNTAISEASKFHPHTVRVESCSGLR